MDDDKAGKDRYAQVFRHEMGHAVDDKLGAPVTDLRIHQAGWTQHEGADAWIAALGGYGNIPADLQPTVRGAVQAYLGKGNVFTAPTPTFEQTLIAQLQGLHPGNEQCIEGKPNPVEDDLARLRPLYPTNFLLRVCIASQGDNNYFRFAQWPGDGARVYFLNHYYAKPYSLSVATHNHLKQWGDSSAAFSDKEWFAEIYAAWYDPAGNKPSFPAFVTSFFENVVDKMGGPDTVKPNGGGGNPKVPR
jgi:hypothetical protein